MKKTSGKILKKKNEEQGTILGVTLVLTVALLIIALPFLFKLSAQYRATEKSFKSIAALSLAEAGVERAIWELNHGNISTWSGDDSLRTLAISSFQSSGGAVVGDIDISVADSGEENPLVEATGRVSFTGTQEIAKTIRVELDKEKALVECAVFADTKIEFLNNTLFDSYDSGEGDYGGPNVNNLGHIGTNATQNNSVTVTGITEIYGNIACGPGGDPEVAIKIDPNATVYGEIYALTELKELPDMTAPEGLPFLGDYTLGGGGSDTIDQSAEYHNFHLKANTKVTVTADVTLYVNNDFKLDNNTEFEIAEGASVTIYIGNKFDQKSTSTINNLTKEPTRLLILGTDTFTVDTILQSNSEIYGVFYAPKVNIDFQSNYDFYGAVVCKEFVLNSNAQFHFDEALEDFNLMEGLRYMSSVKSWKEKIS